MGRQRRSRAEWQNLVDEFKASGLTQPEFADRRGLNAKTLENWTYRLRHEAKAGAAGMVKFVPVQVRTAAPPAAKMARTDDGEAIEVAVGAVLCVRFVAGVDCEYLGRLVSTLARSAAC